MTSVFDDLQLHTSLHQQYPSNPSNVADEAPSASRELSERISMLLDSQHDIRRVCIAKHLRLFEIQKEDTGYGCGYRNLQTIIASIVNDRELRCAGGITEVLTSIQQIQEGIELAWMVGFDPVGASNLDFHLKGTRKWIGATEIAAFLQYHRIRVQLVDVRLLLNRMQKQRQIVEWVWRYFNSDGPMIPLYFQHQGHSRVIIGCIESSNTSTGKELLIYDPLTDPSKIHNALISHSAGTLSRLIRCPASTLTKSEYQIVAVHGVIPEQFYETAKDFTSYNHLDL